MKKGTTCGPFFCCFKLEALAISVDPTRCFGDREAVTDGAEGTLGVGQYVAIAHAELPDDLGTNAIVFGVHARRCFLAGMLNAFVSVQLIEDAPSLDAACSSRPKRHIRFRPFSSWPHGALGLCRSR